MALHTHRRQANSERLGKLIVEQHQAEIAALADPRPSTVTLAHFVRRNLGVAIAAGQCTVTCAHRLFHSLPRLTVYNVRYIPDNGRPFVIVTTTGDEWQTHYGGEELAVTWHNQPDGWDQLSWPMRYALRHLAGEGGHKPRWNTLRALQTRGHLCDGQLTPSALNLYRRHREAFAHD